MQVQRQSGANTVQVVDLVRAAMPGFRAQLPQSVNISLVNDRSISIQESVADVKFTLYLTLVLVVLVIFVFLRNVSATIIPSLSATGMSLVTRRAPTSITETVLPRKFPT